MGSVSRSGIRGVCVAVIFDTGCNCGWPHKKIEFKVAQETWDRSTEDDVMRKLIETEFKRLQQLAIERMRNIMRGEIEIPPKYTKSPTRMTEEELFKAFCELHADMSQPW